jgi:anti-sigma B factor antagonist
MGAGMNITKTKEESKLTVALEGRLDTTTAPQLEGELRAAVDGVTELEFDLAKLEYISSAGLRVLLAAQKVMNRQGSMVIRNANSDLMDIFEVTGFTDILNIE